MYNTFIMCLLKKLKNHPVAILDYRQKIPIYYHQMPNWQSGMNRSKEFCTLRASDDWSAILEFLQSHSDTVNTYKAYCKIIEKFILWLIVEKEKPLTSLDRMDCSEFYSFLKKPEPTKYWVGDSQRKFIKQKDEKGKNISNPKWKPFIGKYDLSLVKYNKLTLSGKKITRNLISYGMSEKSVIDASIKISSMFKFLFDSGYITAMPTVSIKIKHSDNKVKRRLEQHFLEERLIFLVIQIINEEIAFEKRKPKTSNNILFSLIRTRFIIKLFFATGLRISELASLKNGDIQLIGGNLYIDVIGKGDKPRSILLYEDGISAIREFRNELKIGSPILSPKVQGFSGSIIINDDLSALVPQKNLKSHISNRRVDQLIIPFFKKSAEYCLTLANKTSDLDEKEQLYSDSKRLQNASAHWLRHSHGTYFAIRCEKDIKAIMERLGHSDPKTSSIYLHVIEKFF